MFGFSKRTPVVQPVALPKQEPLTLSSVVHKIVGSGFTVMSYGGISRIGEPKKNQSVKNLIEDAVKVTANALRDESPAKWKWFLNQVERQLEVEQLIAEVSQDVYSDVVEVARSRAMVKAFRAGLDHSDVFLKIVESTNFKEIRALERWVERSNAYLAVNS